MSDQKISTEEMLKWSEKVQSMTPQDAFFKAGGNQVEFRGTVIESGYEFFEPAVSISENGHLLFREDASCVDSYHNEKYTNGRFTKEADAVVYLAEKYKGVSDWERTDVPVPAIKEDWPTVWSDPAYARERAIKDSEDEGSRESFLDRIVFQDRGLFAGRDGHTYHGVDFAYACDQKEFGVDESLPNPYLMTSKRKGADGKLAPCHTYYLSEDIYQRLMGHANTDGLDNSRWTGVVAADATYTANRNGKGTASVDLTRAAEKRGHIARPSEPFNEAAHDKFVKRSLAEMYQKRQADAESQYGY